MKRIESKKAGKNSIFQSKIRVKGSRSRGVKGNAIQLSNIQANKNYIQMTKIEEKIQSIILKRMQLIFHHVVEYLPALKREKIPQWRKCDNRGEYQGLVITDMSLSHLSTEDMILLPSSASTSTSTSTEAEFALFPFSPASHPATPPPAGQVVSGQF